MFNCDNLGLTEFYSMLIIGSLTDVDHVSSMLVLICVDNKNILRKRKF